jgi:hypothetical protein
MDQTISPRSVDRLVDRLQDANVVTAELLSDVIREGCRRLPAVQRTKDFDRLEHLIQSCAWTDAALTLLALELPQWRVRRIVYDEGEWHCALSRCRDLPDWLDQPIETRHTDLALAILSALVEAARDGSFPGAASVPAVSRPDTSLEVPLCCDNFA